MSHRFKVFLVDEAYTSKTCCKCHGKVENAAMKFNHPKHRHVGPKLCYKMVRCSCNPKMVRNRDRNAAANMTTLLQQQLLGQARPYAFVHKYMRAWNYYFLKASCSASGPAGTIHMTHWISGTGGEMGLRVIFFVFIFFIYLKL